MKKITAVIAGVIMLLMLAACGESISLDVNTAADALAENVEFSEELTEVSSNIALKKYGLDEETVSEAAAYCGTAAVVDEIAVFKTEDTEAVEEKAREHIASQKESYESYAPNEVPKLDAAVIETVGDCVIVCVSNDDSESVSSVIAGLSE
ncbi:MAG: DUF4358 domain-containing protein [Firmicutes bacterium]|nr:DUF4358 domain-containing protein [Bacillota bacterium]